MKKVTFIVGLPGSGKTTLGNKLSSQGAFFVDDINLIKNKKELLSSIRSNHVIIADVYLCQFKVRMQAKTYLTNIFGGMKEEWIFFENDPIQCKKNVRFRNDGRDVEGMIDFMAKQYSYPEGKVPVPVWKCPDEDEDEYGDYTADDELENLRDLP